MPETSPGAPGAGPARRDRPSWAWWLTGGVIAAVLAGAVAALILAGLVAALGVLVAGAVLATGVALVVGILRLG